MWLARLAGRNGHVLGGRTHHKSSPDGGLLPLYEYVNVGHPLWPMSRSFLVILVGDAAGPSPAACTMWRRGNPSASGLSTGVTSFVPAVVGADPRLFATLRRPGCSSLSGTIRRNSSSRVVVGWFTEMSSAMARITSRTSSMPPRRRCSSPARSARP